jgi:hypothetical protein
MLRLQLNLLVGFILGMQECHTLTSVRQPAGEKSLESLVVARGSSFHSNFSNLYCNFHKP